jgi:hypothetical protein
LSSSVSAQDLNAQPCPQGPMAGPIGHRGMISVLCTLGYEPSMLYIRKTVE